MRQIILMRTWPGKSARSLACPSQPRPINLRSLRRTILWSSFQAHSVRWRFHRSEEHTSELQSLMRISYAVFCLKKKKQENTQTYHITQHSQQQVSEYILRDHTIN